MIRIDWFNLFSYLCQRPLQKTGLKPGFDRDHSMNKPDGRQFQALWASNSTSSEVRKNKVRRFKGQGWSSDEADAVGLNG
jgi:hypothetical protein